MIGFVYCLFTIGISQFQLEFKICRNCDFISNVVRNIRLFAAPIHINSN